MTAQGVRRAAVRHRNLEPRTALHRALHSALQSGAPVAPVPRTAAACPATRGTRGVMGRCRPEPGRVAWPEASPGAGEACGAPLRLNLVTGPWLGPRLGPWFRHGGKRGLGGLGAQRLRLGTRGFGGRRLLCLQTDRPPSLRDAYSLDTRWLQTVLPPPPSPRADRWPTYGYYLLPRE